MERCKKYILDEYGTAHQCEVVLVNGQNNHYGMHTATIEWVEPEDRED